MFRIFRKNKNNPEFLYFKNNAAAFEYASQYLVGNLSSESFLYGLVVRRTPQKLKFLESIEKYTCDIATIHGVLRSEHCGTIHKNIGNECNLDISPICDGDFVAIQIGSYDPNIEFNNQHNYFIIAWKVSCQLRVATHSFVPKKSEAT